LWGIDRTGGQARHGQGERKDQHAQQAKPKALGFASLMGVDHGVRKVGCF
jgi:hypothetical protein